MTDLPPPLPGPDPLPYESQASPPAPPRAPLSTIICWCLVWTIVALLVSVSLVPESKAARRWADDGPARPDFQVSMQARLVVGLLRFGGENPASAAQNLRTLEDQAKTSVQRLRLIPLAAEVRGKDDALNRLQQLTPDELPPALQADLQRLRTIYAEGVAALDPADRQALSDHHGYLGKLALSHGLPESDPLRQEVIGSGTRAVGILAVVVIVLGIVGLAGLILLVIGIILAALGTLKRLYQPEPFAGPQYLEAFTIYLVGLLGLSMLMGLIARPSLPWNWALTILLPITMLWARRRGGRFGGFGGGEWTQVRRAFGWHAGRGAVIEIPLGVVGYLAGLPVVAVGIGITVLLTMLAGRAAPTHPIADVPMHTPWQIAQLYITAAVWAPIFEESMFRGALYHHLRRRWSWLVSALVSAVIFAGIHPQGWAAIPALASIGFVLAGLREWRGSVLAPMTAHALNNGAVVTLLVLLMR